MKTRNIIPRPKILRPKITIEDAKSITALLDRGSFKEACLALNIAQPTLSARISTLEDKVGYRILRREDGWGGKRNAVSVTEEGRGIADYCLRLVKFVAENEATAITGETKSTRRLLSFKVVGDVRTPPLHSRAYLKEATQ